MLQLKNDCLDQVRCHNYHKLSMSVHPIQKPALCWSCLWLLDKGWFKSKGQVKVNSMFWFEQSCPAAELFAPKMRCQGTFLPVFLANCFPRSVDRWKLMTALSNLSSFWMMPFNSLSTFCHILSLDLIGKIHLPPHEKLSSNYNVSVATNHISPHF